MFYQGECFTVRADCIKLMLAKPNDEINKTDCGEHGKRDKNNFEFFDQEFTVLEFGLKHIMKKETGNKNKKDRPADNQIDKDFFRKCINQPWSVRMARHHQDDGNRSEIIKENNPCSHIGTSSAQ